MNLVTSLQRSGALHAFQLASGFVDSAHTLYYAPQPSRGRARCAHVHLSSTVRCGSNQRSARAKRVRAAAAEVAETLKRLDIPEHPLASYDLRLPSRAPATEDVSSSSDSSASEDERPAASSSLPRQLGEVGQHPMTTAVISVCQGKTCSKRGSARVLAALQHSTAGVEGTMVQECKCLGQCKRGPAVRVQMGSGEDIIYVGVNGTASAAQLAAVVLHEA